MVIEKVKRNVHIGRRYYLAHGIVEGQELCVALWRVGMAMHWSMTKKQINLGTIYFLTQGIIKTESKDVSE